MPISKNSIMMLAAGVLFGFLLAYLTVETHYSGETRTAGDDSPEAERLAQQDRVLCWVMTTPKNHETKAIHVRNTWGKRCNKLLFMSSESDEKLGAIGLPNVSEGRQWLWAKATGAFKYVWEHHRDEADWFMKADDDTYVILENLRFMLRQFQPTDPIYFGCRFQVPESELAWSNMKFMTGGPGYVLSKEALRRLVQDGLTDKNKCKPIRKEGEDVEMGQCLDALGVVPGDTRDTLGRYRFLNFDPSVHAFPGGIDNRSPVYWQYIYFPQSHGMDGLSDRAISFHYVEPSTMYAMEYLIYHLRLQGAFKNYSHYSATTSGDTLGANQTIMSENDG